MSDLTKNFSRSEFNCSCCGYDTVDTDYEEGEVFYFKATAKWFAFLGFMFAEKIGNIYRA